MDKYPIVHQLDSMDCGAACLAMVCAHYDMGHDLASLREITFVDREGVSLLNIKSAAEKIGLETLPIKSDYNQLQHELPLPAIAHWDQNHFVVVYEVQDDYVIIGDPAVGERQLSRSDFVQNWGDVEANEGVLLLLEKPESENENPQEETNTPQEISDRQNEETQVETTIASTAVGSVSMFSLLQNNKKFWWHLLLGGLVLFLIHLFLPLVLKEVIDSGAVVKNKNLMQKGLLAFGVLGLGRILLELSRTWIFQQEAAIMNAKLVSNYLEKLVRQPIRFFERRLKWDILQRVYDNYKVGEFFQSSSLQILFYAVMLLSSLLVLFLIEIKLFFILLVGFLLQTIFLFLFQKKKLLAKQEMLQSAGQSQDLLFEIINGIASIKLNNSEDRNQADWEKSQASVLEKRLYFTKIEQRQKTILKLIIWAVELAILYCALSLLIVDRLSFGSLIAVVFVLAYVRDVIVDLFDVFSEYQEVKLSIRRLSELSELKTRSYGLSAPSYLPAHKDIEVKGLTFRYGDADSPKVLDEIDLIIEKGKKTAIVGVSGSGKTTLIKLLMGMYVPNDGVVELGDVDVQDIEPSLLYDKMAAVFEDGHIFSDTLEANITMNSKNINQHHLNKAIRIACLSTFMDGLPLGKDTRLGDGGILLSKGQQQQVLLARAFYKNPEILFFDEATNALDGITERRLLKNIDEEFEDKTTVFVAHRLSTIKNADRIVVIHKGIIVEQGTHEELYAKKGAYFLILRNDTD